MKGEIELSRITVVEMVDMEALKGIYFQVHGITTLFSSLDIN